MIFLITGPQKSGKKYLTEKMRQNKFTIADSINEINSSDAAIVDPDDINKITAQLPDKLFCIIKIDTDPNVRKIFALRTIDKNHKIEEEEKFDKIEKELAEKFLTLNDATEAFRQNLNTFSDNMTNIIEYQNDYSEKSADDLVQFLCGYKSANEKMSGIVKDAMTLNIFAQNPDHPDKIETQSADGPKYISPEVLAGMLVGNVHEFWSFMMNYICKSERFTDI